METGVTKSDSKTLIILIGIPASGKSSFCVRHLKKFVRINLDTLHTRRNEDVALSDAVKQGQGIVIDNTNVTKSERAKYIALARQHGYEVAGYFFQSVVRDCIDRNAKRDGANCIPSKAIAAKSNQLELPSYEEGFDRLYYVSMKDNDFEVSPWR